MNHATAERLLRPHADGTASVPVLYDTEREAIAYVLAELERLRAMRDRAMDVQDWHEEEASASPAWRTATYIRNGVGPGVDPRRAVVDGR